MAQEDSELSALTDQDVELEDAEPKRRNRLAVPDEQKIQWAMERYNGAGMETKALAAREGRTEPVVSRAIRSAFEDDLVEVRRVPRTQLHRLNKLENELRRKYPSLQTVFALEVPVLKGDPERENLDLLHEYLGHALTESILDSGFRNNDHVVVGSGRTIFHMADRLRQLEKPLKATGVHLISACGDSYPQHDDPKNILLDADHNTNLLGRAFESLVECSQVSHHIFLDVENAQRKEREHDRRKHYYELDWKPTIGFLGVGVVDELHQLYRRRARDSSKPIPPGKAENLVEEMLSMISGIHNQVSPHFWPVAELAMHLFVVRPAGGVGDLAPEFEKLARCVEALNDVLFAPGTGPLRKISSLAIIGGGAKKAEAIHHLLVGEGDPGLSIRTLFTDSVCARKLVEIANRRYS